MKKIITSLSLAIITILSTMAGPTMAADVEVSWLKNPEPDVLAYNVRWSLTSGGQVIKTIPLGNVTNVVISGTNFVYMTPVYFTVVAVNTSGLQGVPSDEAVWIRTNAVAPTKVLGIGARSIN